MNRQDVNLCGRHLLCRQTVLEWEEETYPCLCLPASGTEQAYAHARIIYQLPPLYNNG